MWVCGAGGLQVSAAVPAVSITSLSAPMATATAMAPASTSIPIGEQRCLFGVCIGLREQFRTFFSVRFCASLATKSTFQIRRDIDVFVHMNMLRSVLESV